MVGISQHELLPSLENPPSQGGSICSHTKGRKDPPLNHPDWGLSTFEFHLIVGENNRLYGKGAYSLLGIQLVGGN